MFTNTSRLIQRGISLIELIIFIVIISVALTGILLVMNQVTAHSADPLVHKQAIAVAESLLEEVELQDFLPTSGVAHAVVTPLNRADTHIVSDYHNFTTGMAGISDLSGSAVAGLGNYNASITVVDTALGGIVAGSAVLITVTVSDPQNNTISIAGYKTAY
ncbi:MAG: type II secretion system protein [Sideroxydans sp.]|nr:type II secretion system protein [Sideroxydans sp.]